MPTPDQYVDGSLAAPIRPRRETVYVYDVSGVRVNTLGPAFIDFEHDERLQSSDTLRLVIPGDSPKAVYMVEDRLVEWQSQGRRYYIDQVVEGRTSDGVATVEATCNALWMLLADRKYVGSLNLINVGAASGIDYMLDDTGWVRGPQISTITDLRSLEVQDASRLAQIWAWAKAFDQEVQFDSLNKIVDFVPSVGQVRGVSFRYGRNLTTVQRTARAPRATRLYAFGRDDLDISGVNGGVPYLEDYSYYTGQGVSLPTAEALYRRDDMIVDRDIVDEDALLDLATATLAEWAQPWVKYEADVVDLSALIRVPDASFGLGDSVQVYDRGFNWSFRTRVVRRQVFPLEPWRDRVELSSLDDPAGDTTNTSRPASTQQWELFRDSNDATVYALRNNGTYRINRIPISYAVGGEAVYGLDVSFTGAGAGTLSVSAFNHETNRPVHEIVSIPYTNGQSVHRAITWSRQDLSGVQDYYVRAVATASPAASASGIDIPIEGAQFWILARGGVKRTPVLLNSVRYDYIGAVQSFTVPDGVTSITVEAHGSAGAAAPFQGGQLSANGAMITATFDVIPGQTYDVYVGGRAGAGPGPTQNLGSAAGWPDAGSGGTSGSTYDAGGGGGSTYIVLTGQAKTAALLVAAGAGGTAGYNGSGGSPGDGTGGAGGFLAGAPGITNPAGGAAAGGGATQFAGGAAGSTNGNPGTAIKGGDGGNGGALAWSGAGGGGGWFGGGGGAFQNPGSGGGGGGGSGYVQVGATDIAMQDDENGSWGYMIVSWDTPV